MVGKLLNARETKTVVRLIRECCPEHADVEQVRWIGACPACRQNTLYCCYKGFSSEASSQSDFLHFCTSCYQHSFSSQLDQEDVGLAGGLALCPFCGYDWSNAYRERAGTA